MRRIIVLTLGLMVLADAPVRAQSCNFVITNVNFGNVDVLAGGAVDTTATLSINCTGTLLLTVRICPNIGAGSGGANATARLLQGPSSPINYQLYQNAARTVVWGSNYWGLPGTPPTIDVPLSLGGTGSATRTIFGRLFANQQTAPAGSYSSNFTAAHDVFDYGYTALGLSCTQLLPQQAHPTFIASATVPPQCSVSAQTLSFGSQGVLSANVDAAGQVSVTCTNGTPYTVALDGGLAAAPPTARKMSKGAETITYGIYQDAARTLPWGSTVGTTVAGTGSGLAQPLVTYGRVAPQPTPSPGNYTDSVVATITY